MSCINNKIVGSVYPPESVPGHLSIPLFLRATAEEETLDLPFNFDCDSCRGYSRRQVLEQSQRFSTALRNMGLEKGEFVAISLPNIPEYFTIFLGVMEAGLVPVNFNYASTIYELESMSEGMIFSAVLMTSDQIPKLNQVTAFFEAKLVVYVDKVDLVRTESPKSSFSYHTMIAEVDTVFDPVQCNGSDTAFIIFSSGTTGVPKKVMASHQNVIAQLKAADRIEIGGIQDSMLIVAQFFNIAGIMVNLKAFHWCFKLMYLPKFRPSCYIEAVKKFKPTTLSTPPTLMSFIANCSELNRKDLVSLRAVRSGGAPLRETLRMKFAEKVGLHVPIQILYGSSETVGAVTATPLKLATVTESSVGFVLPNLEMKVVAPESGEPLGPKEKGELCFRGIQIFQGYLYNDEATSRSLNADGWFHTGDFGYYDESGFVYVEGRIKDLIKTHGHQVSPEEIENVIRKLGQVQDVVVFGIEDEKYGEIPRALVVRDSENLREEDVKNIVKENLIAHKQLRGGVRFVKELPVSSIGKVLRREARAWDLEN